MNARSTKMAKQADRDTLRAEYRREDLGKGVRGKYHKQYLAGTNLVLLDPDVSSAFPTAELVNTALRKTMNAASRASVPSKSTTVSPKKKVRQTQ
jgi:hypothetical protein